MQQISFKHHILNGKANSNLICIVFGYDYFLNKRDLKIIRAKYKKIFLIIDKKSQDQNLFDFFCKKYVNNLNIELHFIAHITSLDVCSSNSQLFSTNTFCEKVLNKCYVPLSINEKVEELDNLRQKGNIIFWVLKSLIDYILSFIVGILTLPCLLISFIIISLQSKGGFFYVQSRISKDSKPFNIYKFRSMNIDAEKNGAQFSKKNDDRIYPYGKFMRKTRIDELPQIINVFRNEISLIGPRPERKFWTDQFEKSIPYYSKRHIVKPGISGYAQVMFPYASGEKDTRQKLMYDLFYIKNWSPKLEISILFKTIYTIFSRQGV